MLLIASVLTGGAALHSVLFFYRDNTFMDFYNVIIISHSDPYQNGGIYPPLTYSLYYLIGEIVLPNVSPPIEINNVEIRLTQEGQMCLFVFFLLAFFLFYKAVGFLFEKSRIENEILATLFVFTTSMLFAIERANTLLFTLDFVIIFLASLKTDNKSFRNIGLISLALAASIKIYAAVFLVLLCKNERLKQLKWCIILCIIFNTVPFLFTGGSPLMYIQNLLDWGVSTDVVISPNGASILEVLYVLESDIGIDLNLDLFTSMIKLFVVIATILFIIKDNELHWETIAVLTIMMIMIGGVIGSYYQLFMIPAFILFLNQSKVVNLRNIVFFTCFMMMFIPLPNNYFATDYFYVTTLLSIISTVIMFLGLIAEKSFIVCRRL